MLHLFLFIDELESMMRISVHRHKKDPFDISSSKLETPF